MSEITDKIAAQIKAMKLRGDRNQDIASWFGINQGRISDVCGKNPKPKYANITPEKIDIPPPGPYKFGGGGLSQLYRTIIEARNHWEDGDVRMARVKFERAYRTLGQPSDIDSLDEVASDLFYDERGCLKKDFK